MPNKELYSRVTKCYPKKDQAILFNALDNTKIADYILAVGKILGPKALIAASRISNNRICIYLDQKDTADNFLTQTGGITLKNQFIPARKLVAATKKIIFSNVYPCIPDSLLIDILTEINLKPASSIQNLHLRFDNGEEYEHLLSFRRIIYVYSDKEPALPDSYLITFEDQNYRIFLSNDQIKCYLCKERGHIAEQCESDEPAAETSGTQDPPLNETPMKIVDNSMEVQQQKAKRALSSTTSESASLTTQETQPPRKNKKLKKENSTPSNPNEASENSMITSKDTNKEKVSIKEMLLPIKPAVTTKFENKEYPINFSNFCLLIDMVNGIKTPLPIVNEFTTDTKGIVQMLEENYSNLKNRCMKIRFTKLKRRLLTPSDNQSSDEATDSEKDNKLTQFSSSTNESKIHTPAAATLRDTLQPLS